MHVPVAWEVLITQHKPIMTTVFLSFASATIFSRQLMSLQLPLSIELVLAQRHRTVKMPRCQKLCKDRDELFEESITT